MLRETPSVAAVACRWSKRLWCLQEHCYPACSTFGEHLVFPVTPLVLIVPCYKAQLDLCHAKRQKVNELSQQMHSWAEMDTVCVTSGDAEDCETGKDWYWEPVLLLLFESDSSRQVHWIASVSCALYHRLISVWVHDVWVTNHHLQCRSVHSYGKGWNLQCPAEGTVSCLPLRGSIVVAPHLQGFVHYQVLQAAS